MNSWIWLFPNRVFVSAVLNFSFWSENESERYTVRYKDKDHTGYWALCAAMNRALEVSRWDRLAFRS